MFFHLSNVGYQPHRSCCDNKLEQVSKIVFISDKRKKNKWVLMQRAECSRRRDIRVLRVALCFFIVLKPERPLIKDLHHTLIKWSVSSIFWCRRAKKKTTTGQHCSPNCRRLSDTRTNCVWVNLKYFHIQFNLHKTVNYDFFQLPSFALCMAVFLSTETFAPLM